MVWGGIVGNTFAETTGGSGDRPNILLIIADDQGYGDCSIYPEHAADVKTPKMDEIGKAGAVFTDGYVTAPVCSPSRTGMITGRYQERWNVEAGWRTALPERATTIAEHLRALGYATMMIGKNDFGMHLPSKEDRRYPMNHGYDHLLGFEAHAHDYFLLTSKIEKEANHPHDVSANVGPLDFDRTEKDFPGAYTTDLFTDAAIDFAKTNVAAHKPFFTYLAYNAVHDLVEQTPKKYLDLYGVKPIPLYEPSMGSYLDYYHIYNKLGKVNETDMRKYYLADLACLDENVGRLLGALDQMGIAENTLVVFISDNGGSPNTGGNCRPLRGSKFTTFEGGVRIPFMIKWPGKIKGGQMISEPAMSIDLLPTFVEAAGGTIKPEEEIDGVSLLGRAEGKEDDSLSGRTLYWKFLKQWAIRRGEWKLVVGKQSVHKTVEASWVLGGPDSDKPQLFNLKSDVAEQKDVSQEHPEIVKELTESYKKWEGRHGEWGHGEPGKY
ncbi:MAG TPA: sulfatase-like hydrolase/transferase [Tepidisphaeraceae bacterium]|nr:sulfatase-like hydrolase/transferase [Tepidisphaeraceae bacterium]